jgi:hypothetical protein
MPTFVTIGYGDRAGHDRTGATVLETAYAADAALRERGAVMGIAKPPVQVRNPDGTGVAVTPGAFMTSVLPVAGFAIIEADSLEDAIAQVASVPCAVAHGVVEVWPLDEA